MAEPLRILYGGSVKPDNIDALMAEPDIDGALVGGASLDADAFARIVEFRSIRKRTVIIVITIVHVIACLFLILVVLLQTGKGADMGAVFGGGSRRLFGTGGAGNFLTRLTTGHGDRLHADVAAFLAYTSIARTQRHCLRSIASCSLPPLERARANPERIDRAARQRRRLPSRAGTPSGAGAAKRRRPSETIDLTRGWRNGRRASLRG